MKPILLLFIAGAALVGVSGCNHAEPSETTAPASGSPPAGVPGGRVPSVAPMASGGLTGMTPMPGAESVQGAGGGSVGSAAKEQAKRKIATMGSGSLGNGGGEPPDGSGE